MQAFTEIDDLMLAAMHGQATMDAVCYGLSQLPELYFLYNPSDQQRAQPIQKRDTKTGERLVCLFTDPCKMSAAALRYQISGMSRYLSWDCSSPRDFFSRILDTEGYDGLVINDGAPVHLRYDRHGARCLAAAALLPELLQQETFYLLQQPDRNEPYYHPVDAQGHYIACVFSRKALAVAFADQYHFRNADGSWPLQALAPNQLFPTLAATSVIGVILDMGSSKELPFSRSQLEWLAETLAETTDVAPMKYESTFQVITVLPAYRVRTTCLTEIARRRAGTARGSDLIAELQRLRHLYILGQDRHNIALLHADGRESVALFTDIWRLVEFCQRQVRAPYAAQRESLDALRYAGAKTHVSSYVLDLGFDSQIILSRSELLDLFRMAPHPPYV